MKSKKTNHRSAVFSIALILISTAGVSGAVAAAPDLFQSMGFREDSGSEAVWWAAEAAIEENGVQALMLLTSEPGFAHEDAAPGNPASSARIRITITPPVSGDYTVTHPFGVTPLAGLTAGATETFIQEIEDARAFQEGWTAARPLAAKANADGRGRQPSSSPDDWVTMDGFTYVANPTVRQAAVVARPDRLHFRIQGPGIDVRQDAFTFVGKVIHCRPGAAGPVARPDAAAAAPGATVAIHVLGNDERGAGLNPATLVITSQPAGGTVAANADGSLSYRPRPGFYGGDYFTYTVQDFCGRTSVPAVVTVFVEDLRASNEVPSRQFLV